jgi:triacylglycerol lipase
MLAHHRITTQRAKRPSAAPEVGRLREYQPSGPRSLLVVPRPHLTEIASTPGARWRPRPGLPTPARTLRELHALRGMVRTVTGSALDRYPRRGDGAPVLLVPGFLVGDRALEPLAGHLADVGYAPHPARIARNLNCSEATTAHLTERLERIAAAHDRPVAIVGHSRGGMLARVLARRRPELVSGVITLASPHREPLALNAWLLAHALALAGAGSLGVPGCVRLSCAAGACCAAFRDDLAAPVPVGVGYLSLYSRRDGVVDWRACLDPAGRHAEVHTSHCGMAGDRVTWHLIDQALQRLHAKAGPSSGTLALAA